MGGTVGAGGYSTPPRPLGVGILAVLIGIFGVLWIVGGVILLATGAAFAYFDQGSLLGLAGLTGVIAGAIVLVVGLIILGIALGLWHQRMWALILALLVLFVVVISDGIAHAFGLGFFLGLILLVYLIAVHNHFR